MSDDSAPHAPAPLDPQRERIRGVFSTQSINKVGSGTTQRKTIQKTYWHVKELDNGDLEVQALNRNYVPADQKKEVEREQFLRNFQPEPEFYVSTVFPKMKELSETIVRGEQHRDRGELYSAEFEFTTATKVDEANVRANFGLGLTYLDRGETTKANDIFQRIVKLDAAFDTEHTQLFNSFGISMRKNGMFEQALDYYHRALELNPEDDHLHLNMARLFFEKADHQQCLHQLRECARLNPGLPEARQFWEWMQKKGHTAEPYPGDAGSAEPHSGGADSASPAMAADPSPDANGDVR